MLSVAGFLIRLLVSYHQAPRVLPHPGAVCAAHVVAVTPRGPSPFRITHLVSQSNLPSWMAFWGSAPRTLCPGPQTPPSLYRISFSTWHGSLRAVRLGLPLYRVRGPGRGSFSLDARLLRPPALHGDVRAAGTQGVGLLWALWQILLLILTHSSNLGPPIQCSVHTWLGHSRCAVCVGVQVSLCECARESVCARVQAPPHTPTPPRLP